MRIATAFMVCTGNIPQMTCVEGWLSKVEVLLIDIWIMSAFTDEFIAVWVTGRWASLEEAAHWGEFLVPRPVMFIGSHKVSSLPVTCFPYHDVLPHIMPKKPAEYRLTTLRLWPILNLCTFKAVSPRSPLAQWWNTASCLEVFLELLFSRYEPLRRKTNRLTWEM